MYKNCSSVHSVIFESQRSTKTYFMDFDNFRDGDVDDGFSNACDVSVLVDVKHLFRLVHITHSCKVLPTSHNSQALPTSHITHSCKVLPTSHNSQALPTSQMKKALREMQTLRAGCCKAEPKIFTRRRPPSMLIKVWPSLAPFPGARDGQTLISMHAISSYHGNRPTNKQTHVTRPPTTDRTDNNTLRR